MHGGHVPLHGRLFAQWMHHAYPRECPFPHMAGAISPVTPDEWIVKVGPVEATMEDMLKHNSTQYDTENGLAVDAMPWTMEEELVAPHGSSESEVAGVWGIVRSLMAMVVLFSVFLPLVKSWSSGKAEEQRVLV